MEKEQIKQELSNYKNLEKKIMAHKKSGREILVIAVNTFPDTKGQQRIFCSYYWNEFGLVGTDLIENIIDNYNEI